AGGGAAAGFGGGTGLDAAPGAGRGAVTGLGGATGFGAAGGVAGVSGFDGGATAAPAGGVTAAAAALGGSDPCDAPFVAGPVCRSISWTTSVTIIAPDMSAGITRSMPALIMCAEATSPELATSANRTSRVEGSLFTIV